MATFSEILPFGSDPIDEVLLDSPPLVAVLAQIRFPPIASIANQGFIGPFQEEVRHTYPVMRPEQEVNFALTPGGAVATSESNVIWRFADIDENWKISLAPSFLSLEVSRYTSRVEFVARFRTALQALQRHVGPQVIDRLGVRYLDRLEITDELPDLRELVRPEVLGVAAHNLGSNSEISRAMSDIEIHEHSGIMHARWGVLPANTALDSLHGPPPASPSWLLDLDMFTRPGTQPFEASDIAELTESFARSIYRVFRWTVSDELLRLFGGTL